MLRSLLLLTVVWGAAQTARAAAPPLMPLPVKVETASGRLAIDGSFSVAATGYSDLRLEAALNRFAARISRQTGIPMLAARPPDASRAALRVECERMGISQVDRKRSELQIRFTENAQVDPQHTMEWSGDALSEVGHQLAEAVGTADEPAVADGVALPELDGELTPEAELDAEFDELGSADALPEGAGGPDADADAAGALAVLPGAVVPAGDPLLAGCVGATSLRSMRKS